MKEILLGILAVLGVAVWIFLMIRLQMAIKKRGVRNKTFFDKICRSMWNSSMGMGASMPIVGTLFRKFYLKQMITDNPEEIDEEVYARREQAILNALSGVTTTAYQGQIRDDARYYLKADNVEFSEDGKTAWVDGKPISTDELEKILNKK